ncbi:hypothetical protein [Rhodoplanes sp. Z2-YC6860]|uniref:hypothetical protein n=1 Tax=Rhodoplanes sp. Z2-YC6860 TaxID=674703 RepID=UPI00078DF423|nr:hypothetical protein [Rhodoplanes sp. Z2-YC6860]AMN43747.1 hypothetical protein RHPLAN_53300 [Rhodoplanes sp. Z2-YC6860]
MLKSNTMFGVPLLIFFVIAASAIGSDDPVLTLCLATAGALFAGSLWRAGAAPIVILPVFTQFAQIATPQIYANLSGVPIEEVSLYIGNLTTATWFALGGLTSFVIGLLISRLGFQEPNSALHYEAKTLSVRKTFFFCCFVTALSTVFERLAEVSAGLTQAMLAASGIQWIGVFMLTCVCFAQRQGKIKYWLPIVTIEIIKGFTGFFGDFRLVFFVILVGIASAAPKLKAGTLLAGAITGIALVVLSAWWSAIKIDYRDYVNQGGGEQIALVPVEDRLLYLADKLFDVNLDTMAQGFDKLARRLGYVDFLASTLRNVPARVPHENGAQISEALLHVIQPRFLFPDKPPVPSDTELTEKITGIPFGLTGRETSVSLGYLAELYIDFGLAGALLVSLLLGLGIGWGIRFVMAQRQSPVIVVYGSATMVALTVGDFGEALIKLLGGFLTSLVISLILVRFVLPPLLRPFGLVGSPGLQLQHSS